jgi:16S rRNA (cytosine1402-N4)-methyltransferase
MVNSEHKSVLLAETLTFLNANSGGLYVDATLGLGGHSEALLALNENSRIIGIDQDPDALAQSRRRLEKFSGRVEITQANFSDLKTVLTQLNIERVDGVIADLGVSSLQFDSETRGFSFRFDAPLDMRMNPEHGKTAAEMLAELSEFEIARIIYEYGEEKLSRRIARRIVERRESGDPIKTTRDLATLLERTARTKEKIHPATRTFQALRIAVNGELEILAKFIEDAIDTLKPEGRLVIISFHSLEDRIVKQSFQKAAGKCFCPPRLPQCHCGAEKKVEILTRKPVLPAASEIDENQRSRSAKLRACRRLS